MTSQISTTTSLPRWACSRRTSPATSRRCRRSRGRTSTGSATAAPTCTCGSLLGRRARHRCTARGSSSGTTCCRSTPPRSRTPMPSAWRTHSWRRTGGAERSDGASDSGGTLERMRGIVGGGVPLPHRRLDRSQIAAVAGAGGGKGTRTVASYDEDSTTMAVAAGRAALSSVDEPVRGLWLATTSPAYVDKTNATAVHAALRLDRSTPAFDAVGSVRSTVGALFAGIAGRCGVLVAASDVRVGRPGGPDESAGGDAAAAVLLGDGDGAPVLAEVVGIGAMTEEFLDRWRVPGDPASRVWEERFGETKYVPLGLEALKSALGQAGIEADAVDALVVAGL